MNTEGAYLLKREQLTSGDTTEESDTLSLTIIHSQQSLGEGCALLSPSPSHDEILMGSVSDGSSAGNQNFSEFTDTSTGVCHAHVTCIVSAALHLQRLYFLTLSFCDVPWWFSFVCQDDTSQYQTNRDSPSISQHVQDLRFEHQSHQNEREQKSDLKCSPDV